MQLKLASMEMPLWDSIILLTDTSNFHKYILTQNYDDDDSITLIEEWCSSIKCAVESNDKDRISILLKAASDTVEYKNPLLLALLVDYAPIIHTIIRSIVQVAGITNEKLARILVQARCPLTNVVSICHVGVIEAMIEKGADVNYREKQMGLAALHMAARAGDLQLVNLLLQRGADIDTKCQRGETPLHKAVSAGNFYAVNQLLSQGADVNSRSDLDCTPLHYAFHSYVERDHTIWLLIRNGADLTARDSFGVTPLHLARDFPEVIEHLLDSGVDVDLKEFHKGKTVLHYILESIECSKVNRRMDSINVLLRHGVDINSKNNDGWTPLHCAFEGLKYARVDDDKHVFTRKQILRLCFEYGGDVNAKDLKDQTILSIAANGNEIWVQTILEHIAKLELQGMLVDDCNFDIIKHDNYFRDYYFICKMELLALKEQKCYENISFFNLLIDNLDKMLYYARNNDLMQSFEKSHYYKKFPIYCAHLSDRMNDIVEKQILMKETARFLSSTLQFINSYDIITEKIIGYLSEKDMRKLTHK